MKALLHTLFICSILLCAHSAMAQEEPTVKTTQLTERLYLLSTNQGEYTTNTIASVGPDGLLLVDTQLEEDAEGVKCAACHKSTPGFRFQPDLDATNRTLQQAYHRMCIRCHRQLRKDNQKTGSVTCGGCHPKKMRAKP